MSKQKTIFYQIFVMGILIFFLAGNQLFGNLAKGNDEEKLMLKKPNQWNMKMRILEGIKEGISEPTKAVTASYLKYNILTNIQTEFDLAEERKQIKKIFNLADVKLLTEADFLWKKGVSERTFHIFRLDSKEYLILISPLEVVEKQQFRIEVFEQSEKEKKNLLDTGFSCPDKNIAVFGFEDAQGKPYFLSFRLVGWAAEAEKGLKDVSIPSKEPTEEAVKATGNIRPPRLIYKVNPVYPEDARKAEVEGIVMLEAETDIHGKIKNIKILKSVPLLDQAAIDAVKQWVYEPFIIDGKPKGVIFTVTVKFSLDGKKAPDEEKKDVLRITGDVKTPKLIKKVNPVYPEEAKKAKVEGVVVLEVETDIKGLVKNIKVVRSVPELDQAAIDAVRQWIYEPPVIDGKPRALIFTVTIKFDLKDEESSHQIYSRARPGS